MESRKGGKMRKSKTTKKTNEVDHAKGGFTLIEILLVVVIIGILAAIAVPKFSGRIGQSKEAAARASIDAIGLALDMYEVDNGEYPSSLNGLVQNSGASNWRGPYLKKGLPKDPWGNDFIYSVTANGYTLTSSGLKDASGSGQDRTGNW